MKKIKNLKLVALLLLFVLASNAFAADAFPVFPRMSGTNFYVPIEKASDWTTALPSKIAEISSTYKGIIIKLNTDIDFDNVPLKKVDLKKLNLFIEGNNKTISGLKQSDPLFSNVGDTVYVQNLSFKNVKYETAAVDSIGQGFLFGSVRSKINAFLVKNVNFENASAKIETSGATNNFGLLAAGLNGNVYVSNVNALDFSLDSGYVSNAGVLFGSVEGSVNLDSVQVSGSMTVLGQENELSENGIGVGGVIGNVLGNLTLTSVKSGMKINAKVVAPASAITSNFDYGKIKANSGIGGVVGKINGSKAPASITGCEFSGSILSSNVDEYFEMGVGAIVGLVQNIGKIMYVNNINVTDSDSICHNGSLVYLGGVVGAIIGTDVGVVEFMQVNVGKKLVLKNYAQQQDGGAVGGLIGATFNASVVAKKDVVTSLIVVECQGEFAKDSFLSVGGVIGSFWNDSCKNTLVVENTEVANKISVTYDTGKSALYVGGFLGSGNDFEKISISKSMISAKKGISNNFEFSFLKKAVSQFYVGGMIGYTYKGKDVEIDSSTVQGNAKYMFDPVTRQDSYVAGLIGLAGADSVVARNFYYKGSAVLPENITFNLIGSGALNANLSIKQGILLQDGFVHCDQIEQLTNKDESAISNNVYLNDLGKNGFNPSDVYALNQYGRAWCYDDSDAKLCAFLNTDAVEYSAPFKVSFKKYLNGSDLVVYTNKTRDGLLLPNGSQIAMSALPKTGSVVTANGDSLTAWVENNDIWNGVENIQGDRYFTERTVFLPKLVFKSESTNSGNEIFVWNGKDFDILSDTLLPSAIFVSGQDNGVPTYAKGETWVVTGENSLPIENVESLKAYIVSHKPADTITLALDESKAVTFHRVFDFQNFVNATCRMTILGQEIIKVVSDRRTILPEMTDFSIDSVATNKNAILVIKVNQNVRDTLDTIAFHSVLDMTKYSLNDTILFFGTDVDTSYFDPNPSSSDPNSSSSGLNPGSSGGDYSSSSFNPFGFSSSSSFNPYGGSSSSNPVVDPMIACVDSSLISNVGFLKSGKSAAKFSFKLDIKKGCNDMKPMASVSGPNGFNWDSSLVSATRSYNFTFYPLEPGTYKFRVKLAEGKDTTFWKTFKADMSVSGHKWNLAAVGTWPKGVVDNDEATVYGWSQDVLIGDYWQYEALPNVQSVVEDAGYWIYAEKDLEFSLDLPLKKAESDSIAWNLKKNFNGWNLIANPYSWDLEATSVKNFMDPESNESPFWRQNSDGELEVASVLNANEAFWISTDKNRTIKVSTKPTFSSAKASKNSLKKANPGSWSMALVATSENGTSDSWNVLGVGSKNIALEEPPAGKGDFVSVAFEGEGNAKLAKRILAKSNEKEYSWNVDLKASEAGKVKLTLEGLSEVRAMGYKAILVVDDETAEFGSDASVSVDVSTKSKKALLKVVPAEVKVVTASGISDVHYSVAAGRMDVLFSVPFAMAGRTASVNLMDVNGKVIARALGKANAGSNALQIASPVRNGVYVLQVRVGNDSRVVRLAL